MQALISQALGVTSAANDLNNDGVVNAADIQIVIVSELGDGCAPDNGGTGSTLVISGFSPFSGPAGTLVTAQGSNFGASPQISMPAQAGGTIAVPLASVTATSVSFVIPAGAATGPIMIVNGTMGASTSSSFTVTPASTFGTTVTPSSATLIQGQSVAYSVQATSTNGFDQLAQLSVSGLPSGVTAAFAPAAVASGGTSILTLSAPVNQAVAVTNFSVNAAATVQGLPVTQSSTVSLAVVAPTTSLIGRTVISNPQETPLAGVTISSLGLSGTVGSGGTPQTTGCTGFTTVSDAAGNFALTNLPQACTGTQLFEFNGTTATSPAGQYAGVNLVFTLTMGAVTASPVLVHLPRIDNVETFNVTQNAATDQTYNFTTIPGLSVTVYAGTTLTAPDGTTPNPFPLSGVQVPVDRLPDMKPNVPTMVRVFIVAFQPAESTASQPVAITFPNVSNTAPGTDMPLMTLNPQYGQMEPYGTGAVSADGTQVIPDMDPAHSGHRYGLVHFDWHGQMPEGSNESNPSPDCCAGAAGEGGAPRQSGDPVDVGSGLQFINTTDIKIHGFRGSIEINRTYRTLTTNTGPFGLGWQYSYGWQLNTGTPNTVAAIELIAPDGNQYLFSRQTNGTLINTTVPFLQGAVMTTNASGVTTLRYPNGNTYQFQAFAGLSPLYSITDRYGNATTFTETPLNASIIRITKIADPVGRTLTLAYNASGYCTSVTDPIGRTVTYTYNSSGTLATATDPNGGVTTYTYDAQNRMVSMTDARGVVMFQDVYDSNGHVSQQTQADGGVFTFAYTMANPLVATSPIIATAVTDPLGNQMTYRFNIQGYLTDVTDALGQMKSFIRAPGSNLVLQVTGSAQCSVCGPPGRGPMSYTYDGLGNKLSATDTLGNTFTYTYDPVFNLVTSITDALNHKRSFTYDATGDVITFTDENGHNSTFTYDSYGQPLTSTDPLGNKTTITYDSAENPVSVTDPLGNTTTNTFDGVSRMVATTDALGRKTAVVYDSLDRTVSLQDGRRSTRQFSYDRIGELLTVTDPRSNVVTFAYDNMTRLTARTDALGRSEAYQYDLDGNTTKYTDRRGQVSTYQYDSLNRLINETYQDGTTASRTYDPYSRVLTINDSSSGMFSFAYDAAGRLVSENQPGGAVNYTVDALGRTATRQVAGQPLVTYAYDPAGNLSSAAMPAAGIATTYDARNMPVQETRTNGVNSGFTFDPVGRLLSLIHSNGAAAINTQTYAYDPVGNRIGASNDISQALTTQSAAATVDASNELSSDAQTTYTYDANGNRLSESGPNGSYTYVWDTRNRLTSITDGNGNTTSFKYDSFQNLIEMDKTGAGIASQRFVIDATQNIASLTDALGLPVAVLTGDKMDSHSGSVDSAGNVTFGIGDAIGSMVAITGANGNIAGSLDYEPYGRTTGTAPVAFPFAYTGRIPIVGNIYYYRNRFYDAGTGRFLSEDPIGFDGGDSNLYRYVSSSPTNFRDPAGLAKWLQILEGATSMAEGTLALAALFVTLPETLTAATVITIVGGASALVFGGFQILFGAYGDPFPGSIREMLINKIKTPAIREPLAKVNKLADLGFSLGKGVFKELADVGFAVAHGGFAQAELYQQAKERGGCQ